MVSAQWRFWQIKGHTYEASTDRCRWPPRRFSCDAGEGDRGIGRIAWWQGDILRASREYAEALELQRGAGDPAELANALYNFGIAYAFAGDDR